jgi:hypothetical protein
MEQCNFSFDPTFFTPECWSGFMVNYEFIFLGHVVVVVGLTL